MASIGLDKKDANADESLEDEDSQGEDPHKKSDYFDTSKDRIGAHNGADDAKPISDDEEIDLGFSSNKKGSEAGAASASKPAMPLSGLDDLENLTEEEQTKAIEEQFQIMYEGDAEL